MSHTICYISNQTEPLSDTDLNALFNYILKNNPPREITGILLFNNGIFLQVLEGEKEVLKILYKSIKADKRHHKILTIFNQPIEKRIFSDYNAGFSILKSKRDLKNLNGYLSLFEEKEKYPSNVQELLKPFLL
jgi:hypothetical protein